MRQHFTFAIPGDLNTPTGGYAYARRLLSEWQAQDVEVSVLQLPASFPEPDPADMAACAALFEGGQDPFLVDALAYGAFTESLAQIVGPHSTVLVHHLLCDEQGLDPSIRAQLEQSERAALRHARHVIAASPTTARDLTARMGVDADRITIAIPGTDRAPQAALAGNPPHLLAVGTMTPRKGYGHLIAALDACRDLDWTCDIVGAIDRDAGELARIETAIATADLGARVRLRGKIDDIEAAYLAADLFVSPSLHEGYGMAVVEAMAHGLPVVTTDAGALAETAPCARLVTPANAAALTQALRPLIQDRDARLALGATCRAFALGLPDWSETASIIARAVDAAA